MNKVINLKFAKKWYYKITVSLLSFLLPVFLVQAQASTCDPAKELCNPISSTSINDLIRNILQFVIRIGIPIIALAIIYSGFLFVAARGNSEKLGEAKKTLIYTLIGAVILLGAWAIAQLISDTVLSL